MGKTIEGVIPTLFGGVSRQPPQVRQPNQLEVFDNALASVITGGFEKRPTTQLIAKMTELNAGTDYNIHAIDRSPTEKTIVAFEGGLTPSVEAFNALTGANLPVTTTDTIQNFIVNNTGVNSLGIIGPTYHNSYPDPAETTVDWTFVSTAGAVVWKVEGSADNVVFNNIATGKTGTGGSFSTTIGAVVTGDHNFVRMTITTAGGSGTDKLSVWAVYKSLGYLHESVPEDIYATSVADFTFTTNRLVNTAMSHLNLNAVTGAITSTVQQFSNLPTATGSGNIHRVRGTDVDGFGTFFVKDNGAGDYIEIVDPTVQNVIAESTMPHQLVRSADGLTFTFSAATWNDRAAGNAILNPDPSFIGRPISYVAFYRNRLALLSDETCALSQSGDVFNLFAQKATAVLDSDPIERGATTVNVNLLNFATVFRKLLFLTSNTAQFELGSGDGRALTGETAEMDMSTTYQASNLAYPVSMGDVLYFPGKIEGAAVVYEYSFQDTSFNNTALDISRHVLGYIPNDVLRIVTDSASNTMFVLTTGEQNSLFIYRTFFDGSQKLQSAWGKYTFGATEADAYVQGMALFDNWLYLVIERPDGIWLEKLPVETESTDTSMPYMPLLDQRQLLTGVYVSATNLTTFTSVPQHDEDFRVVEGPASTLPGNQLSVVGYPTTTTITVSGDHTAGACYVGKTVTMTAELSKIFPISEGSPIVTGRLQLQDLTTLYKDTGYFELRVTPDGDRPSFSYFFEGKILGDSETTINGTTPSSSGAFGHKKVMSKADTVKIEYISAEPEPCTITSVQWRGFFNETGRAG
jgi:hypothetical protein